MTLNYLLPAQSKPKVEESVVNNNEPPKRRFSAMTATPSAQVCGLSFVFCFFYKLLSHQKFVVAFQVGGRGGFFEMNEDDYC